MGKPAIGEVRRERRDLSELSAQLAALQAMTVGELHARYQEVFGEPSRSRNKDYLRKTIAWRIQELASGGLSERAETRVAALAAGLPSSWRRRLSRAGAEESRAAAVLQEPAPAPARKQRDPRLPMPGTVLHRDYEGEMHVVTVLEVGFEYEGQRYASLSKVARKITGTQWNGFLFFGLESRRKRSAGKS